MYKCLRFTKHVRDLRQPPDVLLGKLKMDGHLTSFALRRGTTAQGTSRAALRHRRLASLT